MKDKGKYVFNGFLQLPNLDKLEVVNAINEYFDSNEREPIRAQADEAFAEMRVKNPDAKCPCCGE